MTNQRHFRVNGTAQNGTPVSMARHNKTIGEEKDSYHLRSATHPQLSRRATSARRPPCRATSTGRLRPFNGVNYGVQFYGTRAFVESDEYAKILQLSRSSAMHALHGNIDRRRRWGRRVTSPPPTVGGGRDPPRGETPLPPPVNPSPAGRPPYASWRATDFWDIAAPQAPHLSPQPDEARDVSISEAIAAGLAALAASGPATQALFFDAVDRGIHYAPSDYAGARAVDEAIARAPDGYADYLNRNRNHDMHSQNGNRPGITKVIPLLPKRKQNPIYIGGGATIWTTLCGGSPGQHRGRRARGILGLRRYIGYASGSDDGFALYLQRVRNAIMHALNGNRNPKQVKAVVVVEKPKSAKKGAKTQPRAAPKKKAGARNPVVGIPRQVVRGHGDYELGKNIGGKIGSWLGGKVHSWISSIFGSGDYEVVSPGDEIRGNSFLSGNYMPQFAGAQDGRVRFGFSEFLGYLPVNTNFTVNTYNLDVASKATFPWSYPMARMYQQYIIHGMLFLVKSNMSQLTTAASMGTIFGSVRYDVDSKQPTSKAEVMNSLFAASARASGNLVFAVECNPKQTIVWPLKVRQPGVSTGDEQLYSMGKIDICSEGAPVAAAKGMEVTVVYDIEFLKPRLNASGGSVTLFADLAANDNTNVLKTIASTPLVPQPRINTAGCSLDPGGVLRFPYDVEPGTVYNVIIVLPLAPAGVSITYGSLTHLTAVNFTGNQTVPFSNSGPATAAGAFYSNMLEIVLKVSTGASSLTPPSVKFAYTGAMSPYQNGHIWVQEADPRVASGLTAVPPLLMGRQEFVRVLDGLQAGEIKRQPLDFNGTRLIDYVEAFRREPTVDVTSVPRSVEVYDLGLTEAIDRMAVYRLPPVDDGYVDLTSGGGGRGSRRDGRLNGTHGEYTRSDDVENWDMPESEPALIWWAGDVGPMPLAEGMPDGEVTAEEYADMNDEDADSADGWVPPAPPSTPAVTAGIDRFRETLSGRVYDVAMAALFADMPRGQPSSFLRHHLVEPLLPFVVVLCDDQDEPLEGLGARACRLLHTRGVVTECGHRLGFILPESAPVMWAPVTFCLFGGTPRRELTDYRGVGQRYCQAYYGVDCAHSFWACPGTVILLCELIGYLLRERIALNGAQGSYTGTDDVVQLDEVCGRGDCANRHFHKEARERKGRTAKPGAEQRVAKRKAVDKWLLCVDKDGQPLHSCNCEDMDVPHRHATGEVVTACSGCCVSHSAYPPLPARGATTSSRQPVPVAGPVQQAAPAAPPPVVAQSSGACSSGPPAPSPAPPPRVPVHPPEPERPPRSHFLFAERHDELASRLWVPVQRVEDETRDALLLEGRELSLHYRILAFLRNSPPDILLEAKAESDNHELGAVTRCYRGLIRAVACGRDEQMALAKCGWDYVRALSRNPQYDIDQHIAHTLREWERCCTAYNALRGNSVEPEPEAPQGVDPEVWGWFEAAEDIPEPPCGPPPVPVAPALYTGVVGPRRTVRGHLRDVVASRWAAAPPLVLPSVADLAHRVVEHVDAKLQLPGPDMAVPDHPGAKLGTRRLYTIVPGRQPGLWKRAYLSVCSVLPWMVAVPTVDPGPETQRLNTRSIRGQDYTMWCRGDAAIDAGPVVAEAGVGQRREFALPAEYGSFEEVTVFDALFRGLIDLNDPDVKELNARKIVLGEEGITRLQSTLMQSIKRVASGKTFQGLPYAEFSRRDDHMEHITLLCVAQWFIARAYLESLCISTNMRPPAFPKGAVCGSVEHRGPIRVYGLVATTVKPFLWNDRFEITKGREFFVDGELRFPTAERDVDGNYKTLFGPVYACDWAVFRRCNSNMSLALRRLTCNRDVAHPEQDELLGEAQAAFILRNQAFYDSLITLYAPFFDELKDKFTEEEECYDLPHPKRNLRISGHKDMRYEGVVTRRCWNRKPYNDGVFKLEKAKSGGKYPRFVVSLGVEASLLGFRITAILKRAMAETTVRVNGGTIHFCKSPAGESLDWYFELLITCPGRFVFVFFSDDSCYATRQRGRLEWFNVDISGCDASHRDCMFRQLTKLAKGHEKWMVDLVAQCEMPVRIKDVADTRMKPNFVELKPKGAFMYSGSTLTTLMANLASMSLALSFSSAPDGPCDFGQLAADVGYRVTGMDVSLEIPEDIQFLKHSPCRTNLAGYRSMLNLGVFLRASGMCDGDLPKSAPTLSARARVFQANLIQGAYKDVHFEYIDIMRSCAATPTERAKYFVDKTYAHEEPVFFDDDSICARYRISRSEYSELCELSRHQYGYHISCTASLSILRLDYGLGPEERSSTNYFFESGRGDA